MTVIPKQSLNGATAIAFTSKAYRNEPATEAMPAEIRELHGINPSGSEFYQPGPSRRLPVNTFVEDGKIMETKM
jgi:hypothetical protein